MSSSSLLGKSHIARDQAPILQKIVKTTLMYLTQMWTAISPKWNFTHFSRGAAAVCSNRLLKGVLVKDSVYKNAPY
jgi:hypothetical protein